MKWILVKLKRCNLHFNIYLIINSLVINPKLLHNKTTFNQATLNVKIFILLFKSSYPTKSQNLHPSFQMLISNTICDINKCTLITHSALITSKTLTSQLSFRIDIFKESLKNIIKYSNIFTVVLFSATVNYRIIFYYFILTYEGINILIVATICYFTRIHPNIY